MNSTKKLFVGLSLVGGVFLATWLLSGPSVKKTRDFIARKAVNLREAVKREKAKIEDNDIHYV